MQAELDKYLREKLNTSLKVTPIDWSVWATKYPVMLQSGEVVDLIWTASSSGYTTSVGKNAFLPLDDLLEKYGQGIKSVSAPVYFQAAKINGVTYAVNANKDIGQSKGLFFRKDLSDKYGFDYTNVKGFEDIEPMLKTIKENEPTFIPFYMNKGHNPEERLLKTKEMIANDRYEYYSDFRYLAFDKTDKKFVYAYGLPEMVNKMKILRSWFEAGYINTDATTAQASEHDTFKAGKSFMFISTSQPGQIDYFKTRNNIDVVMKDMEDCVLTTSVVNGSMVAIGRTCKNPERAMMVLNLLYTDAKLINIINYGVENVHYVKESDNIIKLPEGVEKTSDLKYNPGFSWEFGNQFLTYIRNTADPQKFEKLKAYNDSLKPGVLLGFNFDTENIKTEQAAVNNVWEQYMVLLGTGAVDVDKTIKEMTDKMKASGLDKMVAEFQSQYEVWAKSVGK